MTPRNRELVWGLASAALVLVGSLGPWATLGPLSVAGTGDGRDGSITLVIACFAALVILAAWWRTVTALCGGIVALIAIANAVDISDTGGSLIAPSVGWGLWLTLLAGMSLCASGVVARITVREDPSERATDEFDAVGGRRGR